MRRRVYLVFGGRSGEHEVSLLSARSIMDALDKSKYDVVPLGITKAGRWLLSGDPLQALSEGVAAAGGMPVALTADPTVGALIPTPLPQGAAATSDPEWSSAHPLSSELDQAPVFFPVLHGPMGEDGTIQGLLELAGLPYVGCGVLASAAGMDKVVAKSLFAQSGLAIVPYRAFLRSQWERNPDECIEQIEGALGYPCFVKPANLGSSVGISKARDRQGLLVAANAACRFDRKILIEASVDAREIEVSVLGNDEPQASVPGEIVPGGDFYDYNDKYFAGKAELRIPAPLSPDQAEQVRSMAVQAFQAVDGSGMARVDFFLDRQSGRFYVNEINTIPGFTRISMYPKLWEATGVSYPALLDRLIQLALERHADRQRTQKTL